MYVLIALTLLLVKTSMVVILGCAVSRCLKYDFWLGLLFSWLIIQALQLLGMIVLSSTQCLIPSCYRLWMMIQVVAVLLMVRRMALPNLACFRGFWGNHRNWPLLLLTATTAGLLLLRALWFFDTVHDSQNHYLTRLAYFFQHHSIFAHGPSLARMFCYEWNAQLNAYHYQLLAGTDRALTLASVEVWWVSFLAMGAFCRGIGLSVSQSLWVALLIDTTPLVFNLVGVTKGDVLAMAASVGALAFILRLRSETDSQNTILAVVLLLSYGAGCKSTLLPVFVTFLMVAVIWLYVKHPTTLAEILFDWPVNLAILATILLFLARYVANFVVYLNPLQRGPSEVVHFSWEAFCIGLQSQYQYLFGLRPPMILSLASPYHAALTWGFAFTGWLLLFACAVRIGGWLAHLLPTFYSAPQYAKGGFNTLAWWYTLGLIGVWLFLCGLFPLAENPDFRSYMLRFFLPFLVPPSLFALGYLARRQCWGWQGAFPIVAGFVVVLNLHLGFCPSEIMNTRGLSRIPHIIKFYNHLSSKLGEESDSELSKDLGDLRYYRGKSQSILVFHQPDTVMYPFYGENLEWDVDLTDSISALAEQIKLIRYDWVALTWHDHNEKGLLDAKAILENSNYVLNIDGQWWKLYKRLY